MWMGLLVEKVTQLLSKLSGVRSQGVTRVEQAEFSRPLKSQIWMYQGGLNAGKMVPAFWPHGRKSLCKENGDCPSIPHSEVIQLVSFWMTLVSPESLSLSVSPGCVPVNE